MKEVSIRAFNTPDQARNAACADMTTKKTANTAGSVNGT